MEPVSPYQITRHKALQGLVLLLLTLTLIRAVFFLDMQQVLVAMGAGGAGGFVLGLMMAAAQYLDGEKDYMTICWGSTAFFAVVGMVAGAISIT